MNTIELAKLAKLKISNTLLHKVEYKLLSTCRITGISLAIELPAIEGFTLELDNPIAMPENFLAIAALPHKTLFSMEAPLLAGIYLAIVKHYELLDCPMPAAQQNLQVQKVHPNTLIDSIKFYAINLEGYPKIGSLARFSLEGKDELEPLPSTTADLIAAQLTRVRSHLFPIVEKRELAQIYSEVSRIQQGSADRIAKAILRARKSKASQQTEGLREARKLIRILKEGKILSDKFLSFLDNLFYQDTLLNAEQETKNRVLVALGKHQNVTCIKLAAILKNPVMTNTVESIFAQENDLEIQEDLKEVEVVEEQQRVEGQNSTLSLKEKLAKILIDKRAKALLKGDMSKLAFDLTRISDLTEWDSNEQ